MAAGPWTCTKSRSQSIVILTDLSGRKTFMRIMVIRMPRFFGNLIRKVLRMN
jgi:hypothetical protein